MLSYSYIESDAPMTPPPRLPNGGLYTGSEAPMNAPWRNVPVVPDAHIYVTQNLKSANPPPMAEHAIPGETRPGNNTQIFPNHSPFSSQHIFQCVNTSGLSLVV